MKFIPIFTIILTITYEAFALFKIKYDKVTNNRANKLVRHCEKEYWIEQQLDHFDITNTRTWKQRYFVNNEFYQKGGPIFLMVSGEQFADPAWLLEYTSLEGYMAKKFGAKLIFLEHRFYGMSRPTPDQSVENLVYLNTHQALADTAHFINHMNSQLSIPPSSKWILFGASYAGSLVAWMRYKYPHLVHAAVANSAPLLAQFDLQDFYLVIENALKKHSPNCVNELDKAFNYVYDQLKNPANYQELEKQFKVCHHFDGKNVSSYEVSTFFEAILEVPYRMVWHDKWHHPTIKMACNIIENESLARPIDRLAMVNELILSEDNHSCLETDSYDQTIEDLLNEEWGGNGTFERGWIYQACTEFGWYQSTSGRPFNIPVDAIPIKMYREMCTKVFGSKFEKLIDEGIQRTNLIYGGHEIVNKSSYTVFVHGSNDPWHAAGVLESNNPLVPVIVVDGGEHVPLVYPPDDTDSPSIAKAKRDLMKLVGKWLKKA